MLNMRTENFKARNLQIQKKLFHAKQKFGDEIGSHLVWFFYVGAGQLNPLFLR